jgi:hypothetical protein
LIKLTSIHRDWIVDMTPDTLPDGFSASAWVQREACEGEAQGQHYATQGEAASRGESWAIRWINENDY